MCDVIMATLSGRTACWDEGVWFVWRPQCTKSDAVLQYKKGDFLYKGMLSEDATYEPICLDGECAWSSGVSDTLSGWQCFPDFRKKSSLQLTRKFI